MLTTRLKTNLLFLFILFAVVLFFPKLTFACSTANVTSKDAPSSCQPACGGSASNYQGDVKFNYADGSSCTEVDYFSDPGCTSPGSNQCPAGCTSNDQCGSGFCGGGAANFCSTGTGGRWCVGYVCGYKCDGAGSGSCSPQAPGSGVGPDQATCQSAPSCAAQVCVPNCSAANTVCSGRTFPDGCGGNCTGTWGGSCPNPASICSPATGGGFVNNGCGGNCPGTADCSPSGPGGSCQTCGSYTDTWSCPGGAPITCVTRATTPGGSCGSPEWSGACSSSCASCPVAVTPTPPVTQPPPPACQPLGQGAGCGNPGNCQCQSGLACRNGTCQGNINPPPFCEFAAIGAPNPITPGYDEAGNPSAIPNWQSGVNGNDVSFNFNWQDLPPAHPGGGACSGSGRYFQLTIGVCADGVTYYDPARCGPSWYVETTPNTTRWDQNDTWVGVGSTGPGSARFTIPAGHVNFGAIDNWKPHAACWNGNGFNCDPTEYPPTFQGEHTHTYWYQIENWCSCDGTFDPKFSNTWVFTYDGTPPNPRPRTPNLACQATNPSTNDSHDVCDQSVSPPISPNGPAFGYANANRYNLNAFDGGATSPRHSLYQAIYHIFDITSGAPGTIITPIPVVPDPTPGQLISLDARSLPLINGHTYRWDVSVNDPGTPALPNPDSPSSPSWTFLYDNVAPGTAFANPNLSCFDATNPPPANIGDMSVNDQIPAGQSGSRASGIHRVFASATENSTTLFSNQDIYAIGSPYGSCGSWSTGLRGQGQGTCTMNAPLTPSASGNIYTFSSFSSDNAGNDGNTSTIKFIYKNQCIGPWLQTLNGNVHSNDKVNTPGGPQ